MMELIFLLILGAALYLTPGWLLLAALRPMGLRRWERLFLSVAASLVIVPFYFSVLSLGFSATVSVAWLLPLLVILGLAAIFQARRAGPPSFQMRNRHMGTIGRLDSLLSVAWVILFSIVICLPRLNFLWMGNAAAWGGSGDEYWHLAELVSVAFSGLPPRHYFFPDLQLAYYYWSYIYPSLIINLNPILMAPARALALHSFVEVFAFTGLACSLVQRNFASRLARWTGLWALTIAGGFDFFVTMNLAKYEDWQQQAVWLVSRDQVSSFPTLYLWVTQHVSAAMIFLVGILIWRNLRTSVWLRVVSVAILAAFGLGTSAFVFLSCAVAGLIWALCYRRLWWNRKAILPLALLAAVFMLGAGMQLRLTFGQTGGMAVNDLRVPLLEGLLGSTDNQTLISLDHWLTFIGLPLTAFWILLVEIGLPFLLYAIWFFSEGLSSRRRWVIFLAGYPVTYIALTFLFIHTGPGHNFDSRGMIPVQIAIILGGCMFLEKQSRKPWPRSARWAASYILLAAILAQTLTPLFDLRARVMIALSRTLNPSHPIQVLGVTVASPMEPMPGRFQYIYWINANAPANSLIVEYGPLDDDTGFRLLQRLRWIAPDTAETMSLGHTDREAVNPAAWEQFKRKAAGQDPLANALGSAFVATHHPIVYAVLRTADPNITGELVYADAFVRIIRIDTPAS
jgi:hypothetical protein